MSKNNRNSLTCIPIRRQVKYSKKALTKVYSARRIDELNKHLFYFCRDNNILNLDTRKSKMIVVKEADGFFKGEKVVDREKIKAIQDSGGRYRNITFLKSHETQWFAKNISALIDVSMPNQHGFTAERGIYTAAKQILDDACQREITQAVNIDLENAFNAIPKQAVFLIFRVWKNQIDNNSITQIQRKIQFPTQNFREVIRFHLGELPGWKGAFGNHAGVYEKFIATNDKIMNIFL